ncbi:hypothetical protein AA106555_0849 [Neokomagataea thailandica NBRC 106555]|uniref:Uncharacterized protein n=1 Tax=Neokomagataea thailandica NBRC 106555 TaxID=1223520 RepID=A0ABQ0QPA8_9PROT|nr:hypothetical protein AA106555_0849 [Neokomagataea thailandica NBRC 106555]
MQMPQTQQSKAPLQFRRYRFEHNITQRLSQGDNTANKSKFCNEPEYGFYGRMFRERPDNMAQNNRGQHRQSTLQHEERYSDKCPQAESTKFFGADQRP